MRSEKYLDAVLAKQGLKNDKELAAFLGLVQSAVSHYRTGRRTMDNETCLRIAQALDMADPLPVIMAADMDRAERAGQRSLWEVFSRRMAQAAAPATLAVLVASVTNFVTPSAAQAAPALDRSGATISVMLNQEGCAAGWSKRCVQSVLQRKSVHEFVGFSPESDSVISFETSCTSLRNRSTPLHSVHAFLPPTHLYNVRESL